MLLHLNWVSIRAAAAVALLDAGLEQCNNLLPCVSVLLFIDSDYYFEHIHYVCAPLLGRFRQACNWQHCIVHSLAFSALYSEPYMSSAPIY